MNKIKDTIRKIAPFVKNYRKGFIFAIILIISAAVCTIYWKAHKTSTK